MKYIFKLAVWSIISLFVGTAAVAMFFAVGGCSPVPKIKAAAATVLGLKDAGKPAELHSSTAENVTEVPAGSVLTIVKTESTPGTQTQAAQPAKEVRTVQFSAPAVIRESIAHVEANTGTVDTTVALHRIDVADRRWLMFAAVGCGVAGFVVKSLLPAWPGISNGLLLGAVFAFAAWRLAEVPAWAWLIVVAVGLLMAAVHWRAEWDKNKDGIPDAFQK